MSKFTEQLERGDQKILPGHLLKQESYPDLEDHPEYMDYLQQKNGETVWFVRPNIMDFWTNKPLISETFCTCYPLIAINPSRAEAQAIHVSHDPWFRTDPGALSKKIDSWKDERAYLLLVTAPNSYIGQYEILKLKQKFPDRFLHLPLEIDSRFGMVYDTQNGILLIQLSDKKLFRVYQGFNKFI
jgi:hypothetical protein